MYSPILNRKIGSEILISGLIALLVFSIALIWCSEKREKGAVPNFYQAYYEPAIRMACGQPFGVDTQGPISDDMRLFLKTEIQSITCESVSPAVSLNSKPNTRGWYHVLAATGLIWKVTGISWQVLDGFSAAVLAISAVIIFAIFRLFVPTFIAAPLSILSIAPGFDFLFWFRDLSKAPFILAAIFVAMWLAVRAPSQLRLYFAIFITGLWLGVGYGFRPDVLIILPPLIATIYFFRPVPLVNGLMDSSIATLILLVSFYIAASPALSAYGADTNAAGCTWHFGLLGISEPVSKLLVMPAHYSWLTHFDDGQAWRMVTSYAQRTMDMPNVGYCTPLYDQAGRALYFDILMTFPGDFITRSLSAAKQVFVAGLGSRGSALSGVWVLFFGLFIIILLSRSIRLGLFALFALAYIGSYPAIQFNLRHYFHLAFLTWLPVSILGWKLAGLVMTERKKNLSLRDWFVKVSSMTEWVRASLIFLGICGFLYFILAYARYEQEKNVQRLFEIYSQASGEEAVLAPEEFLEDSVILKIRIPKNIKYKEMLGRPDSNHSAVNGQVLRIDVGGANCSSGIESIAISLSGENRSYVFPGYIYKPLEKKFNQEKAIVFAPLYMDENVTTVSLISPKKNKECIRRVSWLNLNELPSLWVLATIYPDRKSRVLYKKLK
ncbi:hypothetical protein N8Z26_01525 [Burkholderiales bacterium]|nr:hypothetical protein [Burkholderiales bacterium]